MGIEDWNAGQNPDKSLSLVRAVIYESRHPCPTELRPPNDDSFGDAIIFGEARLK
jgi:hypothetical protein